MKEMNKQELLDINGGGISFSFGLLIAAGITFIIGVIDGYIRPLKCRWNMDRNELLEIYGGFNISGSFINSLVRGINALLDLGRSLGTIIRRAGTKNICPIS